MTADIGDLLGQFLIRQNLLNRQLGSLADHPLTPTTGLHRRTRNHLLHVADFIDHADFLQFLLQTSQFEVSTRLHNTVLRSNIRGSNTQSRMHQQDVVRQIVTIQLRNYIVLFESWRDNQALFIVSVQMCTFVLSSVYLRG